MTTIFSTVDGLTSRFKLVDRVIDTVATRLLSQHEAKGATCPSGSYYCGQTCHNSYCHPTGDLHYRWVIECCYGTTSMVFVTSCCDCCD